MKNITYCENCDCETEYNIVSVEREFNVRGDTFKVKVKEAVCSKCGEQVFPVCLAKENDLLVYDEYRRRHGLLTSSEIKEIRNKRNLTQVQLAKMLHCGEKNIARYETGTIQDPVFDMLLRLVDSHMGYAAICQLNGDSDFYFNFDIEDIRISRFKKVCDLDFANVEFFNFDYAPSKIISKKEVGSCGKQSDIALA